MSLIDEMIGLFSPAWQAQRMHARYKVAAYEAAMPTRTHKARRENRNANQLTQFGGRSLREQARWLDNNHDLVIGLLDKIEERIVGARGIIVEPQPLLRTGEVADDLAKDIRSAWAEWSVAPEVTGQYTRPVMERLLARTWLRDGEVFCQMVKGTVDDLTPQGGVPFWLEALESDFVPLDSTDSGAALCQGIFLNDWGWPKKYQVYKSLITSGIALGNIKEIDAENMLHLKFVRRLHQVRGNSLLSGILIRLSALKDYEDAELTAARIAASLGMYVKKGDGQSYPDDPSEDERELDIVPGILFDGLQPGEEVGMIKSDRPNPNLENFRNGQLRAVSVGSRGSYSSIARDYQDSFVAAISRPNYRNWLQMAITTDVIKKPVDLDERSLFNAVYSGPVMPWIDPLKEANGWKVQVRGGAATESDWIRSRGANPAEVKRRRKAEIDENNKLGLVFDTDPANDKGGTSAKATKQGESSSQSERRKK
ncbi:phage portal protein [Serratia symbiotica]|uniref:Phage portal protein, lambda family protein n=1 Tax=Serratia symbiotica SCt-VLC TaxID=1347341 RepID=A0A068RC33_9GAMM|nr:phage portal protein [Serratia symbiotica]CDG47126.1 Phage portal protein, lambda family protein [Serratia symbiotica SCt-VLC]